MNKVKITKPAYGKQMKYKGTLVRIVNPNNPNIKIIPKKSTHGQALVYFEETGGIDFAPIDALENVE